MSAEDFIKLTYPETAWIIIKLDEKGRWLIKDFRDIVHLLISKFPALIEVPPEEIEKVVLEISTRVDDDILKQQAILDHFLGQDVVALHK